MKLSFVSALTVLSPNVKDEPRLRLARLLRQQET
jgi:hypothetical protein